MWLVVCNMCVNVLMLTQCKKCNMCMCICNINDVILIAILNSNNNEMTNVWYCVKLVCMICVILIYFVWQW